MQTLRLGWALVVIACGGLLTGCVQWGDYAEGSECARVVESLKEVISKELDVAWEADSLFLYPTGYESPWCSEWVETALELDTNDPRRHAVRDELETIVQSQRSGVILTVEYAAGDLDVATSPGTPAPSSPPAG